MPNEHAEVRGELSRVFREAGDGEVFTLDELVDRIHAERRDLVSYWLGDLAERQQIDQYFLVVSPAGQGGIERFDHFSDIPPEIYDPYLRQEIAVKPWYVIVYFTKHREGALGAA